MGFFLPVEESNFNEIKFIHSILLLGHGVVPFGEFIDLEKLFVRVLHIARAVF